MTFRLSLSIFILLSSLNFTFSQGFEKGTFAIDAGLGLGIYRTQSNEPNSKEDGAGAFLIPLSFEYGISNRIGAGLYFTPQSYISNPDSSNAATGLNIGILLGLHLYNGKKSTILARLGFGGAGLTYSENKPGQPQNSIRGGGTHFLIGGQWRTYFGNHLGLFLGFDYNGTSLSPFEWSSGTLSGTKLRTVDGKDFRLNLRGTQTTIGLAVKF
jgi:hypothetical protein